MLNEDGEAASVIVAGLMSKPASQVDIQLVSPSSKILLTPSVIPIESWANQSSVISLHAERCHTV